MAIRRISLLAVFAFILLSPLLLFARVAEPGRTGAGYVEGVLKADYTREDGVTTLSNYKLLLSDRTTYYELPGGTTFSPSTQINATYNCAYFSPGTYNKPALGGPMSCSIKTSAEDNADKPEETQPKQPDQPAASGAETKDDSSTLSAILEGSKSTIPDPSMITSKGCDPSTGRYSAGLLNGVNCKGVTKDLASVIAIIRNVITIILLPLSGSVFILMFVVGGVIYITSAGNEQRVALAKRLLTAAVIGLVIVLLAFVFIRIFVSALGGGVAAT